MAISGTPPAASQGTNKPHKSWRDVLPVHAAAELFPLMSEAELGDLANDIKKHGLLEQPVFYNDPELGPCVLDGRNRLDACELIGREVVDANGSPLRSATIRRPARSFDPIAYVVSKNIHRRHLTTDQRHDLIAKLLKAKPEASNRAIAKQVKADHKTVGTVRAKMEGRGEIPHVEAHTDSKGCKQPAKKPPKPVPAGPVRRKSRAQRELEGLIETWGTAAGSAVLYLECLEHLQTKFQEEALPPDLAKVAKAIGKLDIRAVLKIAKQAAELHIKLREKLLGLNDGGAL